MSKKVRFVFKEKAEVREKFPCCVLAHQISVGATKLVWDDKISIHHPYAGLAVAIQKLRSNEREKNTAVSKTRYSSRFELECRALLQENHARIMGFRELEGVPEILDIMTNLGIKAASKSMPEVNVSTPTPETV